MEIKLAWSSLFKIFAMGLLTYVIAPILLTIRDAVVWWAIYRFLYTNKVRKVMSDYCIDRAWVDHAGLTPFKIRGTSEEPKFYLGERQVEKNTFFEQTELWTKLAAQTEEQDVYLKNIEKRIDRLLKHYKQEESNPLRENRASLYRKFQSSYVDEDLERNQVS